MIFFNSMVSTGTALEVQQRQKKGALLTRCTDLRLQCRMRRCQSLNISPSHWNKIVKNMWEICSFAFLGWIVFSFLVLGSAYPLYQCICHLEYIEINILLLAIVPLIYAGKSIKRSYKNAVLFWKAFINFTLQLN